MPGRARHGIFERSASKGASAKIHVPPRAGEFSLELVSYFSRDLSTESFLATFVPSSPLFGATRSPRVVPLAILTRGEGFLVAGYLVPRVEFQFPRNERFVVRDDGSKTSRRVTGVDFPRSFLRSNRCERNASHRGSLRLARQRIVSVQRERWIREAYVLRARACIDG